MKLEKIGACIIGTGIGIRLYATISKNKKIAAIGTVISSVGELVVGLCNMNKVFSETSTIIKKKKKKMMN